MVEKFDTRPTGKPPEGKEWKYTTDQAGGGYWIAVPEGHICANIYYCRTCGADGFNSSLDF